MMNRVHALQHHVRKAVVAQGGNVPRETLKNQALSQKTKSVKAKPIKAKDQKMVKGRIHD